MAVALVDYGAGNLTSVVRGLEAAGAEVRLATDVGALDEASGIVVPGVGHFGQTERLDAPWRERLRVLAAEGRPLLGICLGMQWLFEASDEAPALPGLGLLCGKAVRIPGGPGLKVPHVGWNAVQRTGRASTLMAALPAPVYAYFAHSYAVPPGNDAVGTAEHGMAFAAVVERGSIFGIQCHPEKSGPAGIAMLRNFVAATRSGVGAEARSC